jgi:hypothetical protein
MLRSLLHSQPALRIVSAVELPIFHCIFAMDLSRALAYQFPYIAFIMPQVTSGLVVNTDASHAHLLPLDLCLYCIVLCYQSGRDGTALPCLRFRRQLNPGCSIFKDCMEYYSD